jgi:hypothetical protein
MVSSGFYSAAPAQKPMLHRVGWVGATAGPRKLCAAVRESTRAPLNPPPPPSSPRDRNGSRRRTGAGAEMTREMRKSSSMVPTKTDRAVKLPTPAVVRELPRRSEKRHATSRRTSRSYCDTREALLRCSTPQPAGRLTRRAMAPDAVGSLERPHGKNSKTKNAKIGKTDRRNAARGTGPPQKNRPGAIERGIKISEPSRKYAAPTRRDGSPAGSSRARWWCAASSLQALPDAGNGHRRPARAGRRRNLAVVQDARGLAS